MNKILIFLLLLPTSLLADALFYYDGEHRIELTPILQPTLSTKAESDSSITFRNSHGHIQSLHNDIIVQFQTNWDNNDIQRWADTNQLNLKQVLSPTQNLWLIEAPATIDSIQLANRLHESGQIVSATPNWSKTFVTK